MNEARALSQLQAIDLEIDQATQELAGVRGQVGETSDLLDARAALDAAKLRCHQLESTQRQLEGEVEDFASKIKAEESKLYQGKIQNPKELSAIQREVANFKQNKLKVEDRLLDEMEAYEAAQASLESSKHSLESVEAEWKASQASLAGRQEELLGRLADREQSRRKSAEALPASIISLYEDLRRRGHGRAVARIERNACQGCRITLPTSTVNQTRIGRDLVHCPSCGRVLYADH